MQMPLFLHKYKIIIAVFLSFFISYQAKAMNDVEARAYASFIQDLINSASMSKAGQVCTYGNDEISNLILMQDGKAINLDNAQDKIAKCKAIYISKGSEKILKLEINNFTKNKIMTIGVFEGFVNNGGMVQVQVGRRDFEVTLNYKEVKMAGIRLNALILGLVIN